MANNELRSANVAQKPRWRHNSISQQQRLFHSILISSCTIYIYIYIYMHLKLKINEPYHCSPPIYILYKALYKYNKPEASICSQPLVSSHLFLAIRSSTAHLLP